MSNHVIITGQNLQIAQHYRNAATALANETMSSIAASHANNRATALKQDVEKLQKEVNYYKDLLSKPMYEIANNNENFKKTYDLQQELLADWMVSQNSFRELTFELGIKKLKMSAEEVAEEVIKCQEKVLTDSTSYGNDAKDIRLAGKKIKDIKKYQR